MDKYFLLQMKRVFRVLPFALVTAILLFCGATVASKGIYQSSASDEYSKVQVAIVGDPEDFCCKWQLPPFNPSIHRALP